MPKLLYKMIGGVLIWGVFGLSSVLASDIPKIFKQKILLPVATSYYSDIIETDYFFDAFAVEGLYPGLKAEVLVGDDVFLLEVDEDEGGNLSELFILNGLESEFELQVKTKNKGQQALIFHLYNTQIDAELEDEGDLVASDIALSGIRVISRKGWGADESLRYRDKELDDNESKDSSSPKVFSSKVNFCNNLINQYPNEFKYMKVVENDSSGRKYKWPLQYSRKISKVVIHHTAESNQKGRDPKAVMRAIYYYHAISRGWGDIGYNYVIDREGKIYEGRAGGDRVVGGHTYCFNTGTIGISLMGNFQEISPSKAQLASLINLTDILTRRYNIHPLKKDIFHGQTNPNILGHRDLAATACPGENLYSLLPYIRDQVALAAGYDYSEENAEARKDYAGRIVTDIDIINLEPTTPKKVILQFKNIGNKTWEDNTWLFVFGNPQDNLTVKKVVAGKNFVAADMKESRVRPGEIATFELTIISGYKGGLYTFEFSPVVNGKYKLSSSAVVVPVSVADSRIDYEYISTKNKPTTVYSGEKFKFYIDLKNTGNVSWYRNDGLLFRNEISLGTTDPQDRSSPFKKDNPARLGFLEKQEIKPSEFARFELELEAPEKPGIYTEHLKPVINEIEWLKDKNISFNIKVIKPIFRFISSAKKGRYLRVLRGAETFSQVKIRNIGNTRWDKDKISFEIKKNNANLKIFDPLSKEEITEIKLEKSVKPQTDTYLKFIVKSPLNSPPLNPIKLVPKYNGQQVFRVNIPLWVIVEKLKLKGEDKSDLPSFYRLNTGDIKKVTIKIKNTSNIEWRKHEVFLKTIDSQKPDLYMAERWLAENNAATLNETVVLPSETATFDVYLRSLTRGFKKDRLLPELKGAGMIQMSPIEIKAVVKGKSVQPIVSQNPVQQDDRIRVKLSYHDDEIVINGNGYFMVEDLGGNILYDRINQGGKVSIDSLKNSLKSSQQQSQGMRFIPLNNTILEISSWDHSPAWNKELNDNQYRGIIELRIENEAILVINELPIADYLKGIAEVSNSAPIEKQKVIAVLARSYAQFYMEEENRKFPGKSYDASDDPQVFQKYLGYGYEQRSPNFQRAVEATAGEVVTYNGEIIKTPYFSQSNGRTLSAQEVWGWTDTPYLQSVADPYCKGLERLGHGVGLSGYGATKMAENGLGYREIIQYYYKNVEISRLSSSSPRNTVVGI